MRAEAALQFEGGIELLPPPDSNAKVDLTAPLQPGDVVTYYAEARDSSNVARTDIYFIEIQPFNRRFSQSQQGGGGGVGGGGQQEQNEISRRQKEILTATWNLING